MKGEVERVVVSTANKQSGGAQCVGKRECGGKGVETIDVPEPCLSLNARVKCCRKRASAAAVACKPDHTHRQTQERGTSV